MSSPQTNSITEKGWNELADFARRLAIVAGDATLPLFRTPSAIDNKIDGGFDPVTEADRSAERAMRLLIEKTYPDHGITGEELASTPAKSDFTWILDPIDGTRSFICGMPTWTTLIALTHQGRPILGLVSQPFVREIFIGGIYGAWSENLFGRRRLAVRPAANITEAVLTTVAPENYKSEKQKRVLQVLSDKTRMTRFGGDAYFFAMLASGFVDIAMDAGLKTYDIAALVPIIEGAGGTITTWDGGEAAAGGDVIAAASPALHSAALEIIRAP
ncbi:MAG TPA: histidinol-phosphatase [Aestuariivirgaceae bacterium]|nr:histidinol-phosphatase [Aestuariivirgaceae bacterium]